MVSSPLLLSLSSVFALLALTMLGISFITDNWQEFLVNRKDILNQFNQNKSMKDQLFDKYDRDPRYYTRNIGLFHICFPDTIPSGSGSFNKLGLQVHCITRSNDYFPAETIRQNWGNAQNYGLYMLRSSTLCYAVGLVFIALCLIVGLFACWKQSTKLILWTAALMALGVLFCTMFIGSWFALRYWESEHNVEPFFRSWEPVLKGATKISYGWSMGIFIVGLSFLILATLCMFCARFALKREEDKNLNMKAGAYMMNNYYEKSMMPFYGTYGSAYPNYPAYYGQYATMPSNYGYLTYGGQ
uniref:Claudin domain-containing protein n=1 Tax=Steinernema glaseri TaxID=37863 RepID=A0A1I7ZBN6_9BILA